jgi:phosphoribosylformylglycinamidine cyclo-ligase
MTITYKDAGVDIEAGERLVESIKPLAQRVRIPELIGDLGGFAGLCSVPSGMKDPVMVSGTDGVGTKLEVAFATGKHDTIGVDLVAMCVNDVITTGARPLFFLDYFASSKLDEAVAKAVIGGISEGCRLAGCALLGGETAELPGMYRAGTYDLAGFAVGVVERSRIVDGQRCEMGDAVLGLKSSGIHSNGLSLARKVVEGASKLAYDYCPRGFSHNLGESLLEPTRIYVKAILALLDRQGSQGVHAMAHITGGGIAGNLPRSLPEHLGARIELSKVERAQIFDWIAENGPVEEAEMRKVFNLGVGMCVVVGRGESTRAKQILEQAGEEVIELGEVVALAKGEGRQARVQLV